MDIIVLLLLRNSWLEKKYSFFSSDLVSVLKQTETEMLNVTDPDSDVTLKKGLNSRAVTPQGERGLL